MSKHKLHPPKHAHAHRGAGAPTKVLRNTLLLSSMAVAATGVVVSGGVVMAEDAVDPLAATSDLPDVPVVDLAEAGAERAAEREVEVSRDDHREELDPVKEASLSPDEGAAVTVTHDVTDDDPRDIAKALLAEFGFGPEQFTCLDNIWSQESGWRVDADNPYSSAYGIPQALPGSKMASAGDDWLWNPVTQIRWGLGYIADRYGTPCNAWAFKSGHGWY